MIYEKSGADFERELAQKFTGAGKVHFATDEGKKELAAFIDYVRAGKRKPRVGE